MRHLALLVPSLALQLLASCAPGSPTASGPLAPLPSGERTADPKPTAQPADANPADPNPADLNAAQPNPADPNPADPNPADLNAADPNLATLNAADPNPADPNPATLNAADPNLAHPNRRWMAVVNARIRDASHQFFVDGADLRAEVPERGLTARFDHAGAHIASAHDDAATPIALRTARVGRAASTTAVVAAAPALGDCQAGKADPEGHCIPRLEYASGGLTEWWEAGAGGFEQGWVLTERPEGSGAVRIDIEVGNADATVESRSVRLHGDDGSTLIVSRLAAWDARGDDVPVAFEWDGDGFAVVVDDEGAVYPVEVDPVYVNADWSVDGVAGFEDQFGATVAGAGDTNGDGYDDVLVRSGSSPPVAWLFEGSSTGLALMPTVTLDSSGAVDGAGDVNGDGYSDVVSGVSGADEVHVHHGGPDGLSTTPSKTIRGSSGEEFGTAVSGAGDVNGDGYDDLIVGAPAYSGETGRAYVYLGSPTGLFAAASTTLTGDTASSGFGGVVSEAGDVNGDGYGDVVVGASLRLSETGRAYVYLGSESGLDSGPVTTLSGAARGNRFGEAVAAADVDGDGYDDVVVGAGGCSGRGCTYVYPGSSAGTASTASVTLTGATSAAAFGSAVSSAGDVNDDGYSDILVGAYGMDTSHGDPYAGRAYVYLGSSGGVSSTAMVTLQGGDVAYSYLGSAVVGVGDTDGDGYDDVLVGSYGYGFDFTTQSGAAWVYRGSATATLEDSTALGSSGDSLGISVACAGDLNDDGYDDVIAGAPGYLASTGEALVYHGSASGLRTTADSTLVGAAPGDCFGASVAAAGDTNGDGYDDVIIAAYGSGAYGAAYTFVGSFTGLVLATTIEGDATHPDFGQLVAGIGDADADGYADVAVTTSAANPYLRTYHGSASGTSAVATQSWRLGYQASGVAAAGDVNGDTYDDLLVGHESYDSNRGRVYLHDGSASGTSTSSSVTFTGESREGHFGHSVAGAGDVDDDGYDDVVVGAYAYYSDNGRVYIYSGASTGPSTTASTTLDGLAGSDAFGGHVGAAGDVNADGYDDIVVASAPGYGSGSVFVYPGSASGITSPAITTSSGFPSLGSALATGDFNGDGLLDIVIGDSGQDGDAGRVSAWYGCIDADGDAACEADDCDDADAAITSPYADLDGDGYGDALVRSASCIAPDGYVWDDTDCDDTSDAIHPGATEVCDAADVDEDCDALTDDDDGSATGQVVFYEDQDSDGYGDAEAWFCDMPAGYATVSTDCDDAEPASHPGGTEVCDDLDNDCNGDIDDDAVDKPTWYADADSDGFTDPATWVIDCVAPPGFLAESADPDCDDGDPTLPFALYADTDSDGYGDASELSWACSDLPGYVDDATDCDDASPTIHPGATEVCDGLDDDCDGTGETLLPWYADADGDGYTDAEVSVDDCEPPVGYAAQSAEPDCDDTSATVHPGADDTPYDRVDQDCDGSDDPLADPDRPGVVGEAYAGKQGCGCTSAPGTSGLALGGVLAFALLNNRRRRR